MNKAAAQRGTRPPAPFIMRPLRTAAERTEAGALVEDRVRWLELRGLPVSVRRDIPDLYRDPPRETYETVGLFEDDRLLTCLMLDRAPDLTRWGTAGNSPSLYLSHVHTLPAAQDDVLRLLTLWASDHAACLVLPHVRAEVLLARCDLGGQPVRPVLDRLQNMGWWIQGVGPGADGDHVARLELSAESRPGLTALLGNSVPLPRQPSALSHSEGRISRAPRKPRPPPTTAEDQGTSCSPTTPASAWNCSAALR
jgi:hypothetical protein